MKNKVDTQQELFNLYRKFYEADLAIRKAKDDLEGWFSAPPDYAGQVFIKNKLKLDCSNKIEMIKKYSK